MHIEILEKEQLEMLPLLKEFKNQFYLVGGTSLALQIGHRKSIDFDLFNNGELNINQINSKLDTKKINRVFLNTIDQYTLVYNNVNLTFFNYPFDTKPSIDLDGIFQSVDVLTIGAMQAYALGRRSKWKDYVDLYFILHKYKIKDIIEKSNSIFGNQFNDKLFLEQLCYFGDIDFTESVEFLGENVEFETIKNFLIECVVAA